MSASSRGAPRVFLTEVDLRIDAHAPRRRSMDPTRERATSLRALADALLEPTDAPALIDAFCEGLAKLAQAQLENFPENIFYDLDFPAADVLRRARRSRDAVEVTRTSFALMAELQHLYGIHTPIRFRYVHDFSYGFDWAKWVRREPSQDGSVGPFELPFLRYMKRRAHELLDLIAKNDRKYPTLVDARPRNPFAFSREPDDEIELHRTLAARGMVPVPAWQIEARPRCDRDFSAARVEVARELGLLVSG